MLTIIVVVNDMVPKEISIDTISTSGEISELESEIEIYIVL